MSSDDKQCGRCKKNTLKTVTRICLIGASMVATIMKHVGQFSFEISLMVGN